MQQGRCEIASRLVKAESTLACETLLGFRPPRPTLLPPRDTTVTLAGGPTAARHNSFHGRAKNGKGSMRRRFPRPIGIESQDIRVYTGIYPYFTGQTSLS
jgi:hypothetical protein